MVSRLEVRRRTFAPRRAAMTDASVPAWPAPTTITSYSTDMPYKVVNEARSFEFGLSGADRSHCGTTVVEPPGQLRVVTVDFLSSATPIPARVTPSLLAREKLGVLQDVTHCEIS